MMTIGAGRRLINFVKICYRASLPVLLQGRHGVAKSEILRQTAYEMNIGIVVYDLSLMEPPDLVGLPRIKKNQTEYCAPLSLPTAGKGLLVFEELNRAPSYMQAPCLNLLTARRLNDYVLPKGWLPVAAVNPAEDGYEVSEQDPALLSRFARVRVEPDRDEWLFWARKNNVHRDVIGYVESEKSIFARPESNPRAWKYVSDALRACKTDADQSHILLAVIAGLVGEWRARRFLAYCGKKRRRPFTVEQVFSDYASHGDPVKERVAAGQPGLVKTTHKGNSEEAKAKRDWKRFAQIFSNPPDLRGDVRRKCRLPQKRRKSQ